jgi:two-component system chemotaxis response regulator CheY
MHKKVLVVDDSVTIRLQVAAALAPAGFDIVEAIDGEDALSKLHATKDLALVLCDVNMPRMNGLDLLDAANKLAFAVPFVMLTTEGQPDLIARAKSSGAKGWIVKPFKPELLVAAVRKLTAQG